MDALSFSAISGVVASITLLAFCLFIGAPLRGFSAGSWACLVALALVTQVVGHLCVAYSMGKVPASVASVVLLAQAPITVVLAVPFLHERITAAQVFGGVLVLAGIGVVNLKTMRRQPVASMPEIRTVT
jgi:drug/metabolite transporter (DMT)-like permease